MPGFRVDFTVVARVEDTGVQRVFGAALRLSALGAGVAPATPTDKKACSLRFVGRYIEKARESSNASFEPFAELSGSIAFKGSQPEFTFLPTSAATVLKPNEKEGTTLGLQLDFDPNSFKSIPATESELRTLRLPDVPDPKKEFRHFELGVVLLVDGDPVADFDKNGVLDVPLRPQPAGLVLEWPADLNEFVPAGLTFIAKQGDVERRVRWTQGLVSEGRRQFLFRGFVGPEPVDLSVALLGRVVALWEAQDVSDPAVPPAWKTTLEAELARHNTSDPGEFQNQRTMPSNDIAAGTSTVVLPF